METAALEEREGIAVDWSGAVSGAASRIWIASATCGELRSVLAPGSRDAVRALLLERRADPARALVGLDFAFGFPAWYAAERGWRTANHIWAAARDEGETWLQQCDAPFWGRPGKRRPYSNPIDGLRETERDLPPSEQPKSVFQIGGAGAVGTGSIRGMPMLTELQAAGWAIWPFDAPSSHTIVEIYPRWFTGAVVKRSAEARARWLATYLPALAPEHRRTMTDSEDAFDAGVSAIGLTAVSLAPEAQRSVTTVTPVEGAICRPARS